MKSIVKAPTSADISKREQDNRNLSRKVATEGIVLLENNGVLPLRNKKVALFGGGARKTIRGGTGSGDMHERYSVSIEEGLENAGLNVTSKKWLDKYDQFFKDTYDAWHDEIEKMVEGIHHPMEALRLKKQNEFQYPTGMEILEEELTEDDTAIYVIARIAGEADDRKLIKGDYYLDDIEIENLKILTKHYKDVIVVINSGGPIDLGLLSEMKISGVIFHSLAGQEGGNAFGDIVSGKVSPSGKLTNTWAEKYEDHPTAGIFSRESDPLEQDYEEGIYVGYRYFDSFDITPKYPFGFGLSYTTFGIKSTRLKLVGEEIRQTIQVKNTGTKTGKEVIQTYVSLPNSNQETEYQRLVCFQKTKELKPGEMAELELVYSLRELTQYDEERASYILPQGEYIVHTGNSSDNTEIVGKIVVETEQITEVCTNIAPLIKPIKELKRAPYTISPVEDVPTITVTEPIETIVHEYEELPVYEDEWAKAFIEKMPIEDLARLVIGGGVTGDRIVNVLGASGSTTADLYEKYKIPNIVLSDGPAGLNVTPELVQKPTGEVLSTQLYEQYNFGAFREFMKRRLGKPEDGQMHYQYATAWPASVVFAQTWNTELITEVGLATAKEMEAFGVTIWLAPGMNIQRNPLGGRSFEYYSEDPYLSGTMGAAITKGVQKLDGKGVSIKHFVANNSEVLRDQSSSNMSERTLREIYLKGFEIVVKNADPLTVMASYNKVNGIYATNNHDLLVKVLRNEWQYKGVVISDWEALDEIKSDILKAHHSQCDLVTPGTDEQVGEIIKGIEEGIINLDDVKRSASRILNLINKNSIIKIGG